MASYFVILGSKYFSEQLISKPL